MPRLAGHAIVAAMNKTHSFDPQPGEVTGARGLGSSDEGAWTARLVYFLRAMAIVAMAKGLYHWAAICGFVGGENALFENQSLAWQTATIYFAVIELVAAVGLWLATPWGAVVWLTTVLSMAVVELMFPLVYGGSLLVVLIDILLLAAYLGLAWMAARERPP
jgi:hypothetical protein